MSTVYEIFLGPRIRVSSNQPPAQPETLTCDLETYYVLTVMPGGADLHRKISRLVGDYLASSLVVALHSHIEVEGVPSERLDGS